MAKKIPFFDVVKKNRTEQFCSIRLGNRVFLKSFLEHLLLSSSFRNQTRYFFPILTSASIQEGGKPPPLSATRALAFALFI